MLPQDNVQVLPNRPEHCKARGVSPSASNALTVQEHSDSWLLAALPTGCQHAPSASVDVDGYHRTGFTRAPCVHLGAPRSLGATPRGAGQLGNACKVCETFVALLQLEASSREIFADLK